MPKYLSMMHVSGVEFESYRFVTEKGFDDVELKGWASVCILYRGNPAVTVLGISPRYSTYCMYTNPAMSRGSAWVPI